MVMKQLRAGKDFARRARSSDRSRFKLPCNAAAHNGHTDAVTLLLERCAGLTDDAGRPPLRWRTNDGGTALHWAAQNGHLEMVRHLVEKVKVERMPDRLSRTPAVLAKSRGHAAVSDYLSAN